jgi:two-component system, cell cycle sensor histidine kinase and response regulator CckA
LVCLGENMIASSRPTGSDFNSTLQDVADTLLSSSLLEAIPDAIVAVNQAGVILQVNSQTETLFGYTREELVGQRIEILVPDSQREQHRHHRHDFAENPKTRRMGTGLDLRGRRKDASEFPVEISLSPVPIENGIVILSAIRDVSDRKRIEEELMRASEELGRRKDRQLWEYQNRLALIVDSSQDAVIGKDLDGIITSWNKGAELIYGYQADEVIGRPITLLAPPDRQDEISKILESILDGRPAEHFETVRVTKDGKHLNMSITASPIRNPGGEIVGASTIARDVTAQRRAEDQLRQAQKMEAVGRLAGGVAHDFNNILGIITACADLLRSHISNEAMPVELLGHIRDASKRGATLTRQLLAFSRKQPVQPRVLDLNHRLQDVSKLLRPLMGDDVIVAFLPRSESAFVEADPGQLDQIVLNFAVNSRDVMPQGGKLVIETATVDFDEAFVLQHPPMKPGRYIMLAVSDNGYGMDADTVSRIFEPFFTTKEVGKGTGLGLATVYGIVQQSGGHVWVYSEPGHGTTFKVYLPCADEKAGLARELEEETVFPRGDGITILLVEDDPVMRRLSSQILQDQGYIVIEAEDGRSALEQASVQQATLGLVLTDVVMRGMSGPELVLRLMDSHPDTRFLYMSGYTGELVMDRGLGEAITLLEKPFTRADLLKTIRTALLEKQA